MQQFVDRMDEFLEALLSREAMPEHAAACHLCHESIAVWRCRECISPTLICRSCMRSSHRENPFHRIECWNGSYFRRAELSEVGVYLFIQHYTGVAVCDTLARWSNLLDSAAGTKDREEQIELRRSLNAVAVGVIELNSMSQYSLHSFTYFIHSLLLLPCCVIITIIYPHIRLSIT